MQVVLAKLQFIMSNNYSWTGEAWASALPVFGRIINLQFIKELSDGTLPVEKFRSYIAQDELYLGALLHLCLHSQHGAQLIRSQRIQGESQLPFS